MYNIDLYTYWKKPIIKTKFFNIHPLDDPGRAKYYSRESHNYHYLKMSDPFVFKSLSGLDYNVIVDEQKQKIEEMNDLTSRGFNTRLLSPKNAENNKEIGIDRNEKNQKILKENKSMINLKPKKENLNFEKPEIIGYNDFREINKNDNFQRNGTYKEFFVKKLKPYFREKNFKDIFGYDNIGSFKSNGQRYNYAIKKLKSMGVKKATKLRRKYDGYTYYDAPVIKDKSRPLSASFVAYNQRMKQTLRCLNEKNNYKRAMNEEEMDKNLLNQTSSEFCRIHHLPSVVKIADANKVVTKQKVGLSKEMGEKYNPFSLIISSSNKTGRNYVGDLFKH